MSNKRNLIHNAYLYKCPRCQEGDIYIQPFTISDPVNMPTNCSVCNQKFEPEPGFYYGAMFMSYIFSAFLFLALIGFCILVLKLSLNTSFLIVVLVAVMSYFFVLRMSRSIWLNLMVKYDAKAKETKNEKSFG